VSVLDTSVGQAGRCSTDGNELAWEMAERGDDIDCVALSILSTIDRS
jgi:hypothetical protein